MKKTVWVLVVTVSLVLLLGLVCSFVSRNTVDGMKKKTVRIANFVREGKYDGALEETDRLLDDWEKRSDLLQLWTVHEDVDEVTVLLGTLKVSLQEREKLHVLLACAELDQAIDHLYHRDALKLQNFF